MMQEVKDKIIHIVVSEDDIKFHNRQMSPEEYREYTSELNKKSRVRASWYSYDEYLGIPPEQVKKDRLTTPDYNELCWKYYREMLEKENKLFNEQ